MRDKIWIMIKSAALKIIDLKTIETCWFIKEKYEYSYWDSLIISSALINKCSILYSEDMQNGQKIEDKLEIINPFKNKN